MTLELTNTLPNMSEAVKSMFATIAGRYDLLNRVLSARLDLAWRKQAVAMLDGRSERVLDLACGTFDLSCIALQNDKAAAIIGADFCLPMLQAGQRKRQGRAIAPLTADALRLPLPDNSVSAVMMAYGWRNLDDPAAGVREMWRVLEPDGQLLLLEFFRPEHLWPRLFHGSFGRVIMPAAGATLAGNAAAYRYLRNSIEGFLSHGEADALLSQNGFRQRRWRSFVGGISHAVHARKETPSC